MNSLNAVAFRLFILEIIRKEFYLPPMFIFWL